MKCEEKRKMEKPGKTDRKSGLYNKVDKKIITRLEKIVGVKNVIVDPEKMVDYSHDEFSLDEIAHNPDVVVKPISTDEIAEICRLFHTF